MINIIVPELRKMHQEIHKKSLHFTLLENKAKILELTKILMILSIVICMSLIIISIIKKSIISLLFVVPISIYTVYACLKLKSLLEKQKKIKESIKKIKTT